MYSVDDGAGGGWKQQNLPSIHCNMLAHIVQLFDVVFL